MSGTVNQALVSRGMHGHTKEQALRRRDASGEEMAILAKVVNDPNPTRKEVADYIHKLLRMEHIPADDAFRILATLPHDPDALRNWAREVFAVVMHQGIHAHAAFPRQLYPSPQQAPDGQTAPVAVDVSNPANQTPSGP